MITDHPYKNYIRISDVHEFFFFLKIEGKKMKTSKKTPNPKSTTLKGEKSIKTH